MTQIQLIEAIQQYADGIARGVHNGQVLIQGIEYNSPIRELYEDDNGMMKHDQPTFTITIVCENIPNTNPPATT